VGAGIDYARDASGGTGVASTSNTRFLFVPGVRFTLVSSADQRVDLFGEADLGIGHYFTDSDTGNVLIRYQLGPGLRLWFHPQMAFGALVGVRGDFGIFDHGPNNSDSSGMTAVFANFSLLGVF
jgi:hypothetical protein